MAKTDIKLYAIDQQGENVTTTISYVNPDVDDELKKQLVLLLNQTTTNVYKSSDKITTINLDTEGGGGGTTPKTQGVLTLDKTSMTLTQWNALNDTQKNVTCTYNGDGRVYYSLASATETWCSNISNGTINLRLINSAFTLYVYAPATDNYTATEVVTFTVE